MGRKRCNGCGGTAIGGGGLDSSGSGGYDQVPGSFQRGNRP